MDKHHYGLSLSEFITSALQEDTGDGDHTSEACIEAAALGKAVVKIKEDGIVAGVELAQQILEQTDPALRAHVLINDGTAVRNGTLVMEIEGPVRSILKAERLLLNCMQRMSGIATFTGSLVEKIKGTRAKILDTRKTTPNFREFEKQAVVLGGGFNHRFGLYDMILIKDNHIDACGGITKAIRKANEYLLAAKKNLAIEIETRNLEEIREVLNCGNIQRILIDNLTPAQLGNAIQLINHAYETEASGGINADTIRDYAETGVDYISVGALTHSYKSLDISLKISHSYPAD